MKSFDKLKAKLAELFQLDQADLDFGIYRIMNSKREEITRFLEHDLLPQVREAFAQYKSGDKAELQKELDEAIQQAKALGADPETLPKVKELRERLEESVDITALENEVYDHLYNFFGRYYDEGDFISLRRYKEGVYAIPYEGEEVKLYWANHDQYYIKTTEYFRDYAFRTADGRRVHFKIAEADTEKDNIKAANGKDRRFFLHEEKPVAEEDGELVIRFEYRPDLEKRKQADINARIVQRIVEELSDEKLASWQRQLSAKAPTEKNPERTVLEKHLSDYTRRNTFDYFIHKDLGKFLRRELDFYIKNEVMHLDDVENESAPRVEQYLSKIKVIRRIAHKIIDFLAQIENFQKKLGLKKKFVVETNYCMTLDRVPEQLYPEIAACEPQWAEWKELFHIDEEETNLFNSGKDKKGKRVAFLNGHPTLVLDTKHFDADFVDKLLAGMDDLDDKTDGLLIYGDNFQALALLLQRYAGEIRCIYIDPPFNTGTDEFFYKDGYPHSSWLAMMESRVRIAQRLLADDGTFYAHIDYTEKERLKLLLDKYLSYITEIIWRIGWVSGYKSAANKFIRNHDTIYQYGKTDSPLFIKTYIPYPEGYTRRDGNPPSGEGYPLEDTWNCNDMDQLHSIQIMSFSKEKVGNQALTQKNENLIARMIASSSRAGDMVLDYFLGSGTTSAVAHKMGRRYIGVEMGEQFFSFALPRMKRVLHGDPYGISSDVGWKGGGVFKYVRIESYEDALANIELKRTGPQQLLLDQSAPFRESYMLKYMLETEAKGSPSLLNIDWFDDPFNYKLLIGTGSVGETKPVTVDLVETFNWLLGLRVHHMDSIRGFRIVEGTNPKGEKVLVIWRKIRDLAETDPDRIRAQRVQANRDLEEFFRKQQYNTLDSEFDVIYVNGDNNLMNIPLTPEKEGVEPRYKVRLIEEEFKRLMFDVKDV